MQREHISIPKLIAYVLFSVIIFALQTGTFGGTRLRRASLRGRESNFERIHEAAGH